MGSRLNYRIILIVFSYNTYKKSIFDILNEKGTISHSKLLHGDLLKFSFVFGFFNKTQLSTV